jgi:phosphoserine phosphatase
MLDEQTNLIRIEQAIQQIVAQSSQSTYVIMDGDRTLIPTDSTKFFLNYLSLSYTDLKEIFQKDGYSFEAFYKVACYYAQIEKEKYKFACLFTADSVQVYANFLTFIHAVKDHATLILITSGIKQSWQQVIDNHGLDFMALIGGNCFPQDLFVVDKKAKGVIAQYLKQAGKTVFAFGDSLIDFDMLKRADYAYLVVNEKMNKDIISYTSAIQHLQQVSFSSAHHSNIPLVDLKKIANLIKTVSE